MRKTLNLVLIASLVSILACNNGAEEKVTSKGMKYTIVKRPGGKQPKVGEWIVFDFTLTDSKDSLLRSTYREGIPGAYLVQDTARTGAERLTAFNEMLGLLQLNDSVRVNLSMKELFQYLAGGPMPPTVDSTLNLTYALRVKTILSADEFENYRYEKVKSRDDSLITSYAAENKIAITKDTTGLQYIIHNQSGNKKPRIQDCIEVKYAGRFIQNGRVFDANTITMPLSQMIGAWQVGVPMLGEGDSATLFVPSRLAYGPRGYYGIPPDAVLIFDISLLKVKEMDLKTGQCK